MVALRTSLPRTPSGPVSEPFHEWTFPDGTKWAEYHRTGQGFLVRFPGLADFEVSADGQRVACVPSSGTSQATVDHLYHNQVLPLAMSLQGKLVFHASAVEVADQAVVFLGESGRGKSTLASLFAVNGNPFLTDDALVLEKCGDRFFALPSHPSIRLWQDSRDVLLSGHPHVAPPVEYTSKERFLAGDKLMCCREPKPVLAAYVLGDGKTDALSINRLSEADAFIAWVRHTFILDVDNQTRIGDNFNRTVLLATRVPSYCLDYPRRFEDLARTRDAILAHVASLGAT